MNTKTNREPNPKGFWKRIRVTLFWQLIIAFTLIVCLVGGGMTLAWRAAWDREKPFPNSPFGMRRCVNALSEYYERQGNWEQVQALVIEYPCGRDRRHRDDGRDVAILATMDGTIVASGDASRLGQALSSREKDHTTPIRVDGQPVGLLLKYSFERTENDDGPPVPVFIGASVVGISLIVGLFISRRISRPLMELTAATRAVAAGDLDVRVPVRYRGEAKELAIAFNRMADQVKETIVTLQRFISDAAHEIHTPLTGLSTSLELAPDDEFVQRARAQVEQLKALTEGLLDLSRIEANERAQTHTLIELTSLVEEASEHYASWADQAGLTFALTLPETPVSIQGNETQLRRALDNLLDNANKFTPEGGTVSVRVHPAEEWVKISVEDTGIGIPEQDLLVLFSRFHRGRNAATYPGNGLGLAIVKAIAEGHRGQVTAENTDAGARFTLRLPVVG
ncbi:MAG: HAMP domain-containing histidine kinase [Chloroflexi bacterium]|nr:HAMP domain-containing histidine kinase [Chloroflexota bacterium]